MNTSFAECFLFRVRHPERSEAKDFLSSHGPRPSAVEGPSRSDANLTATGPARFLPGPSRRLSLTTSSVAPTAPFTPRRSFNSGSATRHHKTPLPLASAQDDGTLIFGTGHGYPGATP